eukprot:Hpha_TRINITY_DN16465_c1_g4::TRINITY_DN16465_c1_g4_i2::g.160745::m.160745
MTFLPAGNTHSLPAGVNDQVDDTVGVTALVVVPRHELDEVVVEGDGRLRVVDRAVGVADEVRRHKVLGRVRKHTAHLALGSAPDGGVKLLLRRAPLQTDGQVNDRHVRRRHTERHTRKLPVEGRDHLAHGLRSPSAAGDDVAEHTTPAAPVLARRRVDGLLGGGGGVHGGHQTLRDTEGVVDHLRQRREAVRRAARVREHRLTGVLLVVHPHHEHRRVCRRCRNDDLLSTALEVHPGLFLRSEHPGRLHDDVHVVRTPRDFTRVLAVVHLDTLPVHDQETSLSRHTALEAPVHRVVLELVHHVVCLDERVIHCHELNVGVGQRRAEHHAPDTAEPVHAEAHHFSFSGSGAVETKWPNKVQKL